MNEEVISVELREINKTLARVEHDVKNVRLSQESQRDRITKLEAHFEDHWKMDTQMAEKVNEVLTKLSERVAAIETQQPMTLFMRGLGMKVLMAMVLANAVPSGIVYVTMRQANAPTSVERTTTEMIVRPQKDKE